MSTTSQLYIICTVRCSLYEWTHLHFSGPHKSHALPFREIKTLVNCIHSGSFIQILYVSTFQDHYTHNLQTVKHSGRIINSKQFRTFWPQHSKFQAHETTSWCPFKITYFKISPSIYVHSTTSLCMYILYNIIHLHVNMFFFSMVSSTKICTLIFNFIYVHLYFTSGHSQLNYL